MQFDIELEYLGVSYDANANQYGLGTTYVIDLQSFATRGDSIDRPGNCQNRMAASFDGITDFNEFWTYSEYPYLSDNLGSNASLAYPPPSEFWTLSIAEENECGPIHYRGVFSWNDLMQCQDFDGNTLVTVSEDETSITLSGTLYVMVVSPYMMSTTDSGLYRTHPVYEHPFEIPVMKQVNVLSSTGVELFISSIIAHYEEESDGSFTISVLTQSAEYIELTNPSLLASPFGSGVDSADISITQQTSTCLVASSFTCGQIFDITVSASLIDCPPASFVGEYIMGFTVDCPSGEEVCNTFIDDNGGSAIALAVNSHFVDNHCEPQVYAVAFDGQMEFYDDAEFSQAHIDDNYVIGQDTIYVQVQVDFADAATGDNLDIFALDIDNVFVCTADETLADDLFSNLDQQSGSGGCLSSHIDPDGPYNIISNAVQNSLYEAQVISADTAASNIVRFAFKTFDIGRTTMFVHAQITLTLQDGVRRRLQVSAQQSSATDEPSNQIRHFIDAVSLLDADSVGVLAAQSTAATTNHDDDDDQQQDGNANEQETNAAYPIMHIAFSVALFTAVLAV